MGQWTHGSLLISSLGWVLGSAIPLHRFPVVHHEIQWIITSNEHGSEV